MEIILRPWFIYHVTFRVLLNTAPKGAQAKVGPGVTPTIYSCVLKTQP